MGMLLFVRKTKPVRFTSAGLRSLQLADSGAAAPAQCRARYRLPGGRHGGTAAWRSSASRLRGRCQPRTSSATLWPEVELTAFGFSFALLPVLARGDLTLR